LIPSTAFASAPLSPVAIDTLSRTLPQCTGGWWSLGSPSEQITGPTQLAPRLALLAKPSSQLSDKEASDLYSIAKAFLSPAIEPPSWIADKGSFLTCPPKAKEAIAVLEYLAGTGPGEWRGAINAFDWLGLAYENGVGVDKDVAKARRFYLVSRLHWTIETNNRWSDGIDTNLLANVQRAGLRPFLEQLAASSRGAAGARLILAEEALPTDPAEARRLLSYNNHMTLKRLIELEDEGRIAMAKDGSDVPLWSEASRTQFQYRKWSARLVKAASLANGGSVPTSAQRPSKAKLLPEIDRDKVAHAFGTEAPIPMRALVNPQGRAVYVEGCRATPLTWGASGPPLNDIFDPANVLLHAARLYDVQRLPLLPTALLSGQPAYGWVQLPAVHFQRKSQNKRLKIALIGLPPDRCVYSAIMPEPSPAQLMPSTRLQQ